MSALQSNASRFLAVMRGIYDVHEALLRLSENQREAIVGSAVSELDSIVRQEQTLLSRLSFLEKQRTLCCSALASELGVPERDVTMGTFIGAAEGPEREELSALKEKLDNLFKELKKLYDINSRLIRGRLEYIHAVTGGAEAADPDSYNSRGMDTDPGRQSGGRFLDRKI